MLNREGYDMNNVIGQILISHNLRDRFHIPPSQTLTVRVGGLTVVAKAAFSAYTASGYLLSPELAQALCLHKGHGLRFRYDTENHMVHLGPTIGILATRLSNLSNPDPKSLQAELMYLSHLGKGIKGQVYVFTPSGINWANKTVQGYNYRQGLSERGFWSAATYALPDVVYDRVPSRRRENEPGIKETKQKLLAMPYLKYFNPAFLNKWQVYQALSKNPDLNENIPETRLLTVTDMEAMLKKYDVLFLKPCNGSLGRGIIYVKKNPGGQLSYMTNPHGRMHGPVNSVKELMEKTTAVRKGRSYLVQQGLSLAKYHGSNFDIRIIYQKNGLGEWLISKKFARIAPRGSNIANLSSGGTYETLRKLMASLYRKETRKKKYAAVKELCNNVAATLEEQFEGDYGELGLDIGIGRNGTFYLIEVNSKPRKTTFSQGIQGLIATTFRRPLEFAAYLAGFPKR